MNYYLPYETNASENEDTSSPLYNNFNPEYLIENLDEPQIDEGYEWDFMQYIKIVPEQLLYEDYISSSDSNSSINNETLIHELTPLVETVDYNNENVNSYMGQFDQCYYNDTINDTSIHSVDLNLPSQFMAIEETNSDFTSSSSALKDHLLKDAQIIPDENKIKRNKKCRKISKHSNCDCFNEKRINEWLKQISVPPRRMRNPKPHEFLLRILRDECFHIISWEDKSKGIFRLIDEKLVSRIWGQRNKKSSSKELKYDHFARNIRFHYNKTFLPVKEQKVYQFAPKIMKDWEDGNLDA